MLILVQNNNYRVSTQELLSGNTSGVQFSVPIGLSSLIGADSAGKTPSSLGHQSKPQSLADIFRQQEERSSEFFLRPSRSSDTGQGKPLRIVDFVSRLCPIEEEKIISTDAGSATKLLLSIGRNKMKIENVTIEQFNIANLRIFYELLTSNKLPTAADIRDYLSYSIKILELARKYTWESVLRYDDEYRILQHTYGHPWSFDSSHLHEVMLIPRWAVSSNSSRHNNNFFSGRAANNDAPGGLSRGHHTPDSSAPPIASHTVGGQEICCNYNRMKGCQKSDCKFSHACNRKISGRACGKPYSGSTHNHISDHQ